MWEAIASGAHALPRQTATVTSRNSVPVTTWRVLAPGRVLTVLALGRTGSHGSADLPRHAVRLQGGAEESSDEARVTESRRRTVSTPRAAAPPSARRRTMMQETQTPQTASDRSVRHF